MVAGISSEVIIKGKVGVIDSFGQKYFLPRSAFPKDFLVREGAPVSVEVDEKEIEDLKIKAKQ